MTLFEKAAYTVAAGIALLIVGLVLAYWWAGLIPSRPQGVAANAVFLCAGHDRCKLSDVHGNPEYEGEFVLYGDKGSVPADQLNIDPEKTSDNKVWVGSELVPLMFLQNGKVLIPASKYEEGARLIQQVKPRR
jgi:hypothetical protein